MTQTIRFEEKAKKERERERAREIAEGEMNEVVHQQGLFMENACASMKESCSVFTSHPRGNQVDGLPRASTLLCLEMFRRKRGVRRHAVGS